MSRSFCAPGKLKVWLAKAGSQVIVPYRDEDEKRHLKAMGDLGQVLPLVRFLRRVIFIGSGLSRTGMGYTKRTANRRVPQAL